MSSAFNYRVECNDIVIILYYKSSDVDRKYYLIHKKFEQQYYSTFSLYLIEPCIPTFIDYTNTILRTILNDI